MYHARWNLPELAGNPLLEEHGRVGPVHRQHPLRQQLVRSYAYGIPNDDALDAIAAVSPAGVVEVGAGTGYWARLLHDRGVDVLAYDRWPPGSGSNRFVDDVAWFPVQRADATIVAQHPQRTLLLVWPTWNETWPAEATAAFHDAGGTCLVYVGEGPGGLTGDAVLHAQLGIHGACLACSLGVADVACVCDVPVRWRATARVAIPQWVDAEDSCIVFEREAESDPDPGATSRAGRHAPWRPRRGRGGRR